ncbi:hypothetical protein ACOSQ3_011862 [Xanthoceras sorbifolium]
MDIEVGEARALLEGLKVAMESNLFPLLVESDSSNVVNLCNNLFSSRTEVDVIIKEINLRIAPFHACSFTHVSRSCNIAAHSAAKNALLSGCNNVWVGNYPFWLLDVCIDDFPGCCLVSV